MTDREILELIGGAIAQVAPKKARALQGTHLEELSLSALGLDSIALMELIGVIESATGITFADDELVRIDQVMGLVRLIQFKKRLHGHEPDDAGSRRG